MHDVSFFFKWIRCRSCSFLCPFNILKELCLFVKTFLEWKSSIEVRFHSMVHCLVKDSVKCTLSSIFNPLHKLQVYKGSYITSLHNPKDIPPAIFIFG